jgi:hypothetical protein
VKVEKKIKDFDLSKLGSSYLKKINNAVFKKIPAKRSDSNSPSPSPKRKNVNEIMTQSLVI